MTRRRRSLGAAAVREVTLGAALWARASHRRTLPLHGGRRRRARRPRAPSLTAEETLFEVVRRRRGRRAADRRRLGRRRRARGVSPARLSRRRGRDAVCGAAGRFAVTYAGVGWGVTRLVGPPPLVVHGGGSERYDLIEAKRYPILPLALLDLLAGLGIRRGRPGLRRLVDEWRGGVGVRVGRGRAPPAGLLLPLAGGRGAVPPAPVLRR